MGEVISDQRSAATERLSAVSGQRLAVIEQRHGFTLVELMISIAMVVLLLLGINTVFKMSSDTVGTGVAIASLTMADRSMQATFQDDFRRAPRDAPLFIIHSGVASSGGNWMTLADKTSDRDGKALTYEITGTTNEGYRGANTISTPYSIYNDRNHRVDTLAFPIRGTFHRHTAIDGSYTSPISSTEAWVWYGHVALPGSAGTGNINNYFAPGDPNGFGNNNTNNTYASTWVLGRYETLLKDPNLFINLYNNEVFYRRNVATVDLPPLTSYTLPSGGNQRALNALRSSRFDLAGTWLEQLRDDVSNLRLSYNVNLRDGPINPQSGQTIAAASTWWGPFVYFQYTNNPPGPPANATQGSLSDVFRYQANLVAGKPITSRAMAQLVPILATGVSQFIVEFAGDFVTQDNNYYVTINGVQQVNQNYGHVLSDQPDGVTDYIVYGKLPNYPRIRTRWYGLPRDVHSNSFIGTGSDSGTPDGEILGVPLVNPSNANELVDVVPVADVLRTAGFNNGAVFERELPTPSGNYYAQGTSGIGSGTAFFRNFRYTCIWQDGGPTMLRILVKMEDPGGHLPDGQWFEYVLGGF